MKSKQLKKVLLIATMIASAFVLVEPAIASTSGGGGLPFDSWMSKIQMSMTGPFAFTTSILGFVGAGAGLIFGGEINGFMRSMLTLTLFISMLLTAPRIVSAITGTGAEITPVQNIIVAL